MSEQELEIKEAPMKERVLDSNRMDDYLGMVVTPSEVPATAKVIEEMEEAIILPMTAPQQQQATAEEVESRKSLLEDYIDVAVPEHKIEVTRHGSSDTEEYIRNLSEEHKASDSAPSQGGDNETLTPKTLTANRMAQYLGFVDDEDPNRLVEQLEDFVEEEDLRNDELYEDEREIQKQVQPQQVHTQQNNFKVKGDYDKYEFESYIGTEFEQYLKQQYGSKKSALLDRMFNKQYDILSGLEGSEIENKYYSMVDTINTNYDRNTKLQNFKNVLKFFTKFYHYLKFQEDDLSEEEEDLLDVIRDIYTVLNRTAS